MTVWDFFQGEIASKSLYNVSIRAMRLRLSDLQSDNNKTKKLRVVELPKRWEDIERMLQYGGFSYIPEIIWSELISGHHNNPLAGYFEIDKMQKLIARKYYRLMLFEMLKPTLKAAIFVWLPRLFDTNLMKTYRCYQS